MQRHLHPMQQSGYDPLLNIAISSQSLNHQRSAAKYPQRLGRNKSRQASGAKQQQMNDFAILSRVRIRRNHRCQTAKATTNVANDDTLRDQH